MRDYDTVLKSLLRSKVPALMDLLGWHGAQTEKWLPESLPSVQNREIDLLCDAGNGRLLHIELQSTNDPQMPLRMAEYALGILRKTGKFPEQTVLYVGNEPLRMPTSLISPDGNLTVSYRLIDFRNLDVAPLAESLELSDNILTVLGRSSDHRRTIHRVLQRIAAARASKREKADRLEQLVTIAGLRGLGWQVREEEKAMPITTEFKVEEVWGPFIEDWKAEGIAEGIAQGERTIALRQLEKRFGKLPESILTRVGSMSTQDLEELCIKLLDAARLEDLFR